MLGWQCWYAWLWATHTLRQGAVPIGRWVKEDGGREGGREGGEREKRERQREGERRHKGCIHNIISHPVENIAHRNLLVTISLSLASPSPKKLGKHIRVHNKKNLNIFCCMYMLYYVCLLVLGRRP